MFRRRHINYWKWIGGGTETPEIFGTDYKALKAVLSHPLKRTLLWLKREKEREGAGEGEGEGWREGRRWGE